MTRRRWREHRRRAICYRAARSGLEVELDRISAVSRVGACNHRLEGALQVQSRQTASAAVAHDLAVAGVAYSGAGAADGYAAGPAADCAGEGSGVVGREGPVRVEDLDARCRAGSA